MEVSYRTFLFTLAILLISDLYKKSHWVSKGFACLPNTAHYQNHIVLFTSTLKLWSSLYSWLIPPKSINQIMLGEIHLCRQTMQVLHNATKYHLKTIFDVLVQRDQNLQPVGQTAILQQGISLLKIFPYCLLRFWTVL